jgi:hypothetical protein
MPILAMGVLAGCGKATPESTTAAPSTTASSALSEDPSESASDSGESDPGGASQYEFSFSLDQTVLEIGFKAPFNADGTYGSGCTPPSGETVPDGIWAVHVEDWGTDSLTFDLVCFYAFDSEHAIAKEAACQAEYGDDDDYEYCASVRAWDVTNDNLRLRTLPVADGSTFIDQHNWTEDPLGEAILGDSLDTSALMWLYVNDGEITQVHQQYCSSYLDLSVNDCRGA